MDVFRNGGMHTNLWQSVLWKTYGKMMKNMGINGEIWGMPDFSEKPSEWCSCPVLVQKLVGAVLSCT